MTKYIYYYLSDYYENRYPVEIDTCCYIDSIVYETKYNLQLEKKVWNGREGKIVDYSLYSIDSLYNIRLQSDFYRFKDSLYYSTSTYFIRNENEVIKNVVHFDKFFYQNFIEYYNEFGDIEKISLWAQLANNKKFVEGKFYYKYDDKNNWIEKRNIDGNLIAIRKIFYQKNEEDW